MNYEENVPYIKLYNLLFDGLILLFIAILAVLVVC